MIHKLLTLLCCMSLATLAQADSNLRIPLESYWVKNTKGEVVLDPQTSALVTRRGQLLSIGDGSAEKNMQMRLLPIDPKTNILSDALIPLVPSPSVEAGCFAPYLAHGPDLEAMAMSPSDDNVFIIVTEDAYHYELTGDCLSRYGDTGSTKHPTVLLRVEIQNNSTAIITHVKALKFPKKYNVGNSPNDGMEGLTFGAGNTLYLGLEKDSSGHARIFELQVDEEFWDSAEPAVVKDSELDIPHIEDGKNHPINALAYYADTKAGGFLFAAARNDNQVWIIDTLKQKESQIIYLDFIAESLVDTCPQWEKMDNYSIEGMVVSKQNLWLINDPWKVNYLKNATCEAMLPFYERMAPLLTKLPIKAEWVKR